MILSRNLSILFNPTKYAIILGFMIIVISLLGGSHVANAASQADAQDFATTYCPVDPYAQIKIADYMWITNSGGGTDFTVAYDAKTAPVNVNFYVTYCKKWPQGYDNGANELGFYQDGDLKGKPNRLNSFNGMAIATNPGVAYGAKSTGYGSYDTWGTATYPGEINVDGLSTGTYNFCTSFKTITTMPKANYEPSRNACFNISINRLPPPDYNLVPHVDSVSPSVVEAGSQAAISAHIDYSGNVATGSTHWELNQIVLSGGVAPPSGGQSASGTTPCGFYGASAPKCGTWSVAGDGSYSGRIDVNQTGPTLDYPVGTQICYGLSVRSRSYSDNGWQHSDLTCTVIGIKPKVQILGGDLRVGRTFNGANRSESKVDTGISVKPNGTFGSWVEYGIFAPSGIAMASAGGLAANNGAFDSGALTSYPANKLTFANVAPPCAYGCYSADNLGSLPDVVGKYINASTPVSGAPSGSLNVDTLETRAYAYSGDVSLSGTTLQQGKWVVIRTTGTVTITGNIQYTNSLLKSNQDIPQLIIIANRINIDPSVTRVDGWLVAKSSGVAGSGGIVDTCVLPGGYTNDTYTTGLTGANCGQVLTVNGPVMAEKLWLRRTGGSGTGANSGDPAEIFNLRPDAYLWAQTQVTGSSRIQTTYTKEMAPRF